MTLKILIMLLLLVGSVMEPLRVYQTLTGSLGRRRGITGPALIKASRLFYWAFPFWLALVWGFVNIELLQRCTGDTCIGLAQRNPTNHSPCTPLDWQSAPSQSHVDASHWQVDPALCQVHGTLCQVDAALWQMHASLCQVDPALWQVNAALCQSELALCQYQRVRSTRRRAGYRSAPGITAAPPMPPGRALPHP